MPPSAVRWHAAQSSPTGIPPGAPVTIGDADGEGEGATELDGRGVAEAAAWPSGSDGTRSSTTTATTAATTTAVPSSATTDQ